MKKTKISIAIILFLLAFVYGVGVGKLHLPPYGLLHKAYTTLVLDKKADIPTDPKTLPLPVSRQTTIDYYSGFILEGVNYPPQINGKNVSSHFDQYAESLKYMDGLEKIVANWENKFLAFDNEELILYQIIDKSLYYSSLQTPGLQEIDFAFIFKNGSILWCDRSECYYSHDNLQSFQKSLVLDIEEQPYNPNSHGNFYSLVIDNRQFINGKELRVWGNYTTHGQWSPGKSQSENIQIWYTIDEGKTIKTAFSFDKKPGQSGVYSRHVHAVNLNPSDSSFWVQTGDYTGECHWMRGVYSYEKDAWNWEVIATGNHLSHYKTTGFVFFDNYVYWGNDAQDPALKGVWRTPYSNLLAKGINPDLFERVLETGIEICSFTGDGNGIMIASECNEGCRPDGKSKVYFSNDGGNVWEARNTYRMLLNIHPPNSFGAILGNYFDNECSMSNSGIHYWDKRPSLFVNSYFE